MTNAAAIDAPRGQPDRDIRKIRQCLRCKASFPSGWSGERICSRCKSSNAWRNGAPPRSYSSGNRR